MECCQLLLLSGHEIVIKNVFGGADRGRDARRLCRTVANHSDAVDAQQRATPPKVANWLVIENISSG